MISSLNLPVFPRHAQRFIYNHINFTQNYTTFHQTKSLFLIHITLALVLWISWLYCLTVSSKNILKYLRHTFSCQLRYHILKRVQLLCWLVYFGKVYSKDGTSNCVPLPRKTRMKTMKTKYFWRIFGNYKLQYVYWMSTPLPLFIIYHVGQQLKDCKHALSIIMTCNCRKS